MIATEAANSVINCHSHETNSDNDWINIIPEEMWMKLFQYIDDPDDLKNLAEMSPKFSVWLQPRKTAYLYPSVISILIQKEYIRDVSELLKCRLINKHSKNTVDAVLERVPEHFKDFPKRNFIARMKALKPPQPRIVGLVEDIEDIEIPLMTRLYELDPLKVRHMTYELRRDNVSYVDTNSSPFPRRHLFLEHRHFITADTFLERQQLAQDFLDIAGQYFWYFDMRTGYSNYLTLSAWYLGIVQLVRRMPNLRAFLLHNPHGTFRCNQWEWQQLDRVIEDHPFPKLKHLSMLVIEEVPENVTLAILRANKEIRGLKMRKLVGLTSLCQNVQSLSCVVNAGFSLDSIIVGMWPLRQLQIDFSLHESCMQWNNTFQFFKRYESSLTHLQVSFPVAWILPAIEDMEVLRLPNLKELRMTMHVFRGIDFILGLTSLEKFELTVAYPQHECYRCRRVHVEIIDISEYFKNFLESDIWQKMPTLREVVVDVFNVDDKLRQPKYNRSASFRFSRHQLPAR